MGAVDAAPRFVALSAPTTENRQLKTENYLSNVSVAHFET